MHVVRPAPQESHRLNWEEKREQGAYDTPSKVNITLLYTPVGSTPMHSHLLYQPHAVSGARPQLEVPQMPSVEETGSAYPTTTSFNSISVWD